jgi:hypothetical protein
MHTLTRLRRSGAAALVTAAAASVLTSLPTPAEAAAALPTGFSTVMNAASGRCLDARSAGTANGTVVQQYACNGTTAQQWSFTATSDGYVRLDTRNSTGQVVDVADVSTADNAPVHLWAYGGGANQQWLPVHEGGGAYHFAAAPTTSSTATAASAWTTRAPRPPTACSSCSTRATAARPSASRWCP